jgi:hypothetical protein
LSHVVSPRSGRPRGQRPQRRLTPLGGVSSVGVLRRGSIPGDEADLDRTVLRTAEARDPAKVERLLQVEEVDVEVVTGAGVAMDHVVADRTCAPCDATPVSVRRLPLCAKSGGYALPSNARDGFVTETGRRFSGRTRTRATLSRLPKSAICSGFAPTPARCPPPAMQKVEGSSPFSRSSEKPRSLRGFFVSEVPETPGSRICCRDGAAACRRPELRRARRVDRAARQNS